MPRGLVAILTVLALTSAAAAAPLAGRGFTSKRYRYTLSLPSGWGATQAQGAFDGRLGPGSPGSDNFIDGSLTIKMTVQGRAKGSLTLKSWTARLVRGMPYQCRRTGALPSTRVAGSRANVVRFVCSDGDTARVIAFFHDRRAFVIGSGFPLKTEAHSEKTFRRMLATLRFRT